MLGTLCGYAGGSTPDPTYKNMGDHTECVLVEYDPGRIDYARLVQEFLCGHEPFLEPWSMQYRSLLLWHDPEQRQVARELLARTQRRTGERLYTALSRAGRFYRAEDAHQKYFLKMTPQVLAPMRAMYPDPDAMVDSTAAARANAILGGYGHPEDLDRWLPQMGLPAAAERELKRCVSNNSRKARQSLFPWANT